MVNPFDPAGPPMVIENLFDAAGQAQLQRAARTPPILFIRDDFLSDEDCHEIAALAEPLLKRATVCGNKAGEQSAGRTGNNCWLKHDASPRIASIVKRIADLLKLPPAHAESLQVIHYGPTQQYRPHFDGWLHDGSDKSRRTLQRGGQRIWTALCYLNTVPSGGSTRFTQFDLEVRACLRRACVRGRASGRAASARDAAATSGVLSSRVVCVRARVCRWLDAAGGRGA